MFLSERERWIAAERMRVEHREVGVACCRNGYHSADGHRSEVRKPNYGM